MKKISVITPTYNEEENVELLCVMIRIIMIRIIMIRITMIGNYIAYRKSFNANMAKIWPKKWPKWPKNRSMQN